MIFKQALSISLITALLFPDIARCMENEDEKTNIVVPLTSSNSPEKKDEKGDNSDSDNSDPSPQKSPRSNENSSEELTLPTTINLIQKHKQSTDSNSPTSSDEQLTHSLTPSPEKNLGNFIPTSITSTLVLPESKEETKKELVLDPKILPTHQQSSPINIEKKKEGPQQNTNTPVKEDKGLQCQPKKEDVETIIELDNEKEDMPSSTLSSPTQSNKVISFLKEHFPKKKPLKTKSHAKSYSINNEEETETSPLLKDIDIEKVLPTKANFLREALLNLLAQDEEKAMQAFKEWSKRVAQNNLMNELKALLTSSPLLEDIAEHIQELIEKVGDVNNLTVQDWLNDVDLNESNEDEKLEKAEKPSKETLQLYNLFSQAVAAHIAHTLFINEVETLDDEVKSFLSYLQKYKIEENLTKTQWGLVVLGVITAIGNAIAQGTVFAVGLRDFFDKIGLKKYYDGETTATQIVSITTTVLSFIDSLPRDIEECVKLGAPSQKAFSSRSTSIMPYVLALLPMALAFYFFFNIEYDGIKWLEQHPSYPNQQELIKQTWIYLGCLGPWLAFDALLTTTSQLKDVKAGLGKKWNHLKGWLRTTWVGGMGCLKKALKQQPLSEAEIKKKDFIKSFQGIKEAVFLMDAETIDQIYGDLEKVLFKNKENLETNELRAADAFVLLSYFMKHFHPTVEEAEDDQAKPCVSQTWRDRLATGLGVFCTTVASFARYWIYHYIMEYFLNSMGVTNETALNVGSHLLGTIGFLIQGFVEEMAVEENIKDVTSSKHNAHSVHPKASRGIGAFSFIVGLYYTLPSLVVGWLTLQGHSIPVQALALIPYVFTDAHSTAWSLKNNYWSYYEVLPKKSGVCCGKLSTDAKKYKLMTTLDNFITLSENARPRVMMKLDRLLEKFNKNEFLKPKSSTKSPAHTTPSNQSSVELIDINSFHIIKEKK